MTSTLNIINTLRGYAEEIWLHTHTIDRHTDGDYNYTAYQLAQDSTCTELDHDYDDDLIRFKVDDFKCEFYGSHIFRILAKFEQVANLTAKCKTTFHVKVVNGKVTDRYVSCPPLPKTCNENRRTPDNKQGFSDFRIHVVTALVHRMLKGEETDKWLDQQLHSDKWLEAKCYKANFIKRANELISRINANRQSQSHSTANVTSAYYGGRFLFYFTF